MFVRVRRTNVNFVTRNSKVTRDYKVSPIESHGTVQIQM